MKTINTKTLHKAINECKSIKDVENEKLNKIEMYIKDQDNKSCIDIIENTNEYDEYNIDFWVKQYISIEEELEKIADNYDIDYMKIYHNFKSSYKYLYNLINEIRKVI